MDTIRVVLRKCRKLKDGRYPITIRHTHNQASGQEFDMTHRNSKHAIKRTSFERIFTRLLAIAMQNPTIRGYDAN